MAVTSIWPIKGRVDKVINYARNPEKTHDKERLSELHEIEGVVEYAADEMKTEKRAYVTCLHLHSEETAAQEFMETKRLMHNEGGRSCYHGYQSFKADEVDADTAHSIGVALARELWGDRFQVVIATHCNTGHYHNHFVINSVSDVDGKKFYNSPADYRRMWEVSDRLCREAKISVIEYPADRRANYGEWLAEKNGKPTMRSRIREDIDRAILSKKVFDISQTTAKAKDRPAMKRDERLLLKAIIHNAPCPIEISQKLPENINAVYRPDDKKIYVRPGLEAGDIFRGISQELAHAHLDDGAYKRSDHAFTAYCVSYVLCSRYNVPKDMFRFDRLPEGFSTMDARSVRNELSKIRDVANEISSDMAKVLDKSMKPKERRDEAI